MAVKSKIILKVVVLFIEIKNCRLDLIRLHKNQQNFTYFKNVSVEVYFYQTVQNFDFDGCHGNSSTSLLGSDSCLMLE